MSFNRLNYDTCSYKQVLAESIGPGEYKLGQPFVSCKPCFKKPRFRLSNGTSVVRVWLILTLSYLTLQEMP